MFWCIFHLILCLNRQVRYWSRMTKMEEIPIVRYMLYVCFHMYKNESRVRHPYQGYGWNSKPHHHLIPLLEVIFPKWNILVDSYRVLHRISSSPLILQLLLPWLLADMCLYNCPVHPSGRPRCVPVKTNNVIDMICVFTTVPFIPAVGLVVYL